MLKDLKALRISVASPKQILAWSHGEVRKPETINYRTHRAEVDGLMDERIFGPTKNYECYCGKYKKIRYKGIVCDQCGVEITTKRVRRERLGHIKLACPVMHVWFSYGIPNKLSLILDIPQKKLETVIYYARYIVTSYDEKAKKEAQKNLKAKFEEAKNVLKEEYEEDLEEYKREIKTEMDEVKKTEKHKDKVSMKLEMLQGKQDKGIAKLRSLHSQKLSNLEEKFEGLKTLVLHLRDGSTISEDERNKLLEYDIDFCELGMGAEAIKKLLIKIDLDTEILDLRDKQIKTRSVLKKRRYIQRLRLLKGMQQAMTEPAWLVMEVVPVLPPDLRPIIQLPGGRFATSDLNDLYRRVINRNNRLLRLIKLGAPEIILRNEKRMLQEAVDALIDNSHRPGTAVLNARDQAYKSLSDMLRGKQGRFRQNLLGKRVDYSARSVIVAGPELKIYQCGLPKTMALELFKPFVISEIILSGVAPNIKSAKLVFDSKSPEVWDILEKVTSTHPVLLNRAPTLHKQGIQAFFPVLVEGNAIHLHPMVCKGFNADFDGDQMAVHVPLTKRAKEEVVERMFAKSNILLMADGSPVVNVQKDMALGLYYLTTVDEKLSAAKYFLASTEQAKGYFDQGLIKLQQMIRVMYKGSLIETTVGRLMFNDLLPQDYEVINKQVDKKLMGKIASKVLEKYGSDIVINMLDEVKTLGFRSATLSGISVSLEDFVVSENNDGYLKDVEDKENQYTEDYYMGLLTFEEKKRLVEETWLATIDKVAEDTWNNYVKVNNNLVAMNNSGASPVTNPLRQISGVKGLILDPQGRIVELPIRSNYKKGLSTLEYFVAARGTRKGLADTALKTAESGYLTRRLVDIAQDVITRVEDCGTSKGINLYRTSNRRQSFGERITGRILATDAVDSKTGEIIIKAGELITRELGEKVESNQNITTVCVRSPITCETSKGLCTKCYGYNLGTGTLVEKGIAVGIVAAQAMGEAATQLTLDTKHLGARVGTDITQGLPRVEELFEARVPKGKATLSEVSGTVKIMPTDEGGYEVVVVSDEKTLKKYKVNKGDKIEFKKSKSVKRNELILTRTDGERVLAPDAGKVQKLSSGEILLEIDQELTATYKLGREALLKVKDRQKVACGEQLTEGALDPKEVMKLVNLEAAQRYIIDNIQETYGIQGIAIDDKHVEIIVRQMCRFVTVSDPGESEFLSGDYVDSLEIVSENRRLRELGKKTIKSERQMLGLTTASVRTESFLSAASFQEQVRVLTDASLMGKMDPLRGLKENVIIGTPVPLGEFSRED